MIKLKILYTTLFLIPVLLEGQVLTPIYPHFDSYSFKNKINSVFPYFQKISLDRQDSLINIQTYNRSISSGNWFLRKLRYEHFFTVREKEFELNVSPLLILDLGKENGKKIYRNTRGISIQASVDGKFGFYSTFHENQSSFMQHVAKFSDYYGVVPGQSFQKAFKETDYDYAWSEGMLYFSMCKEINVQFGHGKRFVGNGYRSMLYSDNSFSYPHLFVSFENKQIKYTTWFTSFTNIDMPDPHIVLNGKWPLKAGIFHYISYYINNNIEVSGFEGSIIASREKNGKYKFNPLLYNPLIFLNSLNNQFNNYIGTNLRGQYQNASLYVQFLTSPQAFEKRGYQSGIKYENRFSRSWFNLFAEVNHATKGLYTFQDSTLSYTHYSQPLAHPLGENFTEFVIGSIINIRSMELFYKFNIANSKSDSLGYLPALNLYFPERDLLVLGQKSKRNIHEVKISYIVNPHYNMRITLGVFIRDFSFREKNEQTKYFYLSFQTPIFNRYYDF